MNVFNQTTHILTSEDWSDERSWNKRILNNPWIVDCNIHSLWNSLSFLQLAADTPFVFREARAFFWLSETQINHVCCQERLKTCIVKPASGAKSSCSLTPVQLNDCYRDGSTTGKLMQSPFWHQGPMSPLWMIWKGFNNRSLIYRKNEPITATLCAQ